MSDKQQYLKDFNFNLNPANKKEVQEGLTEVLAIHSKIMETGLEYHKALTAYLEAKLNWELYRSERLTEGVEGKNEAAREAVLIQSNVALYTAYESARNAMTAAKALYDVYTTSLEAAKVKKDYILNK